MPLAKSALRPADELRAWGGERLVRGKRVLDIGCGDGRVTLIVAPAAVSVSGVDPDADAVSAARKNARKSGLLNVSFKVGSAQKLPYPRNAFDVVILSWTL